MTGKVHTIKENFGQISRKKCISALYWKEFGKAWSINCWTVEPKSHSTVQPNMSAASSCPNLDNEKLKMHIFLEDFSNSNWTFFGV